MLRIKNILKSIVFLIILYFVISFLGILLNPNLNQKIGYLNHRFKSEKENTIDILLIGSSFIYCSYSPMYAYEKSNFKSYVVAGPEQSIITSYYNFNKTLETQTPKAVVIEIKGLSFDRGEKYQESSEKEILGKKIDLDKIPIIAELNKLSQVIEGKVVITSKENFYNFFTYHNRWNELEKIDYVTTAKYFTSSFSKDYTKGYVKSDGIGENINPMKGDVQELSESYELNISYLDKIVKICDEKSIEVIFISTPNVNLDYYNNYILKVKQRYKDKDLIIMNDLLDEMNFNMHTDMFDWGHANHDGALKITNYLLDYFEDRKIINKKENNINDWDEDLKNYLLNL